MGILRIAETVTESQTAGNNSVNRSRVSRVLAMAKFFDATWSRLALSDLGRRPPRDKLPLSTLKRYLHETRV